MKRSGPSLQIVASCHGCAHIRSVPNTANQYGYQECTHQDAPDRAVIDNAHLQTSTPQWCPMLREALVEFGRGNPRHKVNGGGS